MRVFECNNYNFTDSIITKMELDVDIGDLLITIDYFQGEYESVLLTLRLKKIHQFTFNKGICNIGEDKWTPFTIANISKTIIGDKVQLIFSSIMSFISGYENDPPILNCVCEEVFVE